MTARPATAAAPSSGDPGTFLDPGLAAAFTSDTRALDLRRTRAAVVFWDIVGYSQIASALQGDPEEFLARMSDFFTTSVHVVQRHHGIVHKFLGDGLISVFGSSLGKPCHAPAPDHRSIRAAVAAAIDMRTAFADLTEGWTRTSRAGDPEVWRTGLRCGIAAGPVHHGRLDLGPMSALSLLGHPVNLASRCCTTADPDQILVPEELTHTLNGSFYTQPAGPPRKLRNISGEHQLWSVDPQQESP